MARAEERVSGPSSGASGPHEVIQLGPSGPPPRRRWAAFVVGVVLIGSGVVWAVAQDGSPDSDVVSSPTPTRPAHPAGVSDRVTTVTIPAGRNLFGVTNDWELFGRGPDDLVRIELAAGRITRTPVPRLRSGGPVSFIVGQDRALVRPLDFVPGYQVVDGELPRALPPALRHGGLILPGPRPGTVWAPSSRRSAMRLVRLVGGPTDTRIRLPVNDAWSATSDGSGYVLVSTQAGVWRARPVGLTRISDGTLLAVGPTGWLVRECARGRCANVVVDRHRGTRRVLPGSALRGGFVLGAIAPDGSAAVVFDRVAISTATVMLLDLRTGDRRQVPLSVRLAPGDGTIVWLPDSRGLFLPDAGGRLAFVDARTGEVHGFAASLPPIEQLAMRTD